MKIGFLPLYIKLYDDINVSRAVLEDFYKKATELFQKRGVEVITSDFCRIKKEFEKAVYEFEAAEVDAIVTWHAAYSPSLECIDALVGTKLPVIVMDSTPTLDFTTQQDPDEINWNHGIHGVMDMCSMLKRYGKPYAIAAGHYLESDCIDRVCGFVRATIAAKQLKNMSVGLVGGAFDGMGDFAVDTNELKERFGITVENISAKTLIRANESVMDNEILREIEEDRKSYEFDDNVDDEEYRVFTKSCLALRKCIENSGYNAFSVNFLNVEELGTMPFVECCKAMEKGLGYAGEGDALTAAFTGAFMAGYPQTSFVEIFCPDWKNNTLFLSHMGEMNYRVADEKPLISRTNSDFVKGAMPYAGYARMKQGKGVYVNISRDKDDYQLLICECEMLDAKNDTMERKIRGWMRPKTENTAEFLEKLSKNGATHHSTFIYGATVEQMEYFAQLLSLKTVII